MATRMQSSAHAWSNIEDGSASDGDRAFLFRFPGVVADLGPITKDHQAHVFDGR